MNSLKVGYIVKLNMEILRDRSSIEEANINAEGRVIGYASGDYQVVFFAEQGPLWFSRDELIDTGKRGPKAIVDTRQ